jgi:hypothetical protein
MENKELLRDAAVDLAREGFYVLRVRPGDKRPLDEWKDTMTNDVSKVYKLWSEGEFNVGVAAMPSGVFAIDVDGPTGEAELARLEADNGRLPITMEVRTPGRGGGRHLYFAAPEGMQLLPRLRPGLDIKHNGYLLAPPSRHPTGGTYRWERKTKPAAAPKWLIAMAERKVYDDLPEREHPPSQRNGRWERVEDFFDATFTCQDVMIEALHQGLDWKYAGLHSGNHSYTRPGKNLRDGVSLVVYRYSRTPVRPCQYHVPTNCERCGFTRAQMFSTSDPDTAAGSYGPWRLYVHILHRDDWEAARQEVTARGFKGQFWEPPSREDLAQPLAPTARFKFVAVDASTIIPVRKEWVVPWLVPKGELTLITGKPSAGKSIFTIDLIARLTRGEPLPVGKGCVDGPAKVLFLTGEEDMPSVIVPRLMAAGALLSNLRVNGRVYEQSTGELRGWDLRNLAAMEEFLLEWGGNIVVFDVIKQFMSHKNDNDELEVRRELQPIVDLCHRAGITAIGVRHTVKNPVTASSAGSGSQAYYALCRSELLITKEREFDGSPLHVLTVNKSSYGASDRRLEFTVRGVEVPIREPNGDDGVDSSGTLFWKEGWALESDPDELFGSKEERISERIFREAVIRTLTGAAAIDYTLDTKDFRRILNSHLDDLDWEGGRSDANMKKMERRLDQQGMIERKMIHHGAPRGNQTLITLAEQFRRKP